MSDNPAPRTYVGYIHVHPGLVAKCDIDDHELLAAYKWHITANGYVRGYVNRRHVFMHRLLSGAKGKQHTDHINGDKLDNRRSNLRVCSSSQNQANAKIRKDNKTGYRGVSRKGEKWRAQISEGGKVRHIGYFDNPKDAARAYDQAVTKRSGEFAVVNFNE